MTWSDFHSRGPHISSCCSVRKAALWTPESGIKWAKGLLLTPPPPPTRIYFQNTTPPSIPNKKRKKRAEVIGRSPSKKNESFRSVGRTEICAFHSLAIHFKKCLFLFKMVRRMRLAENVA
ncbi:hypothetical protein CDAR_465421 [Caerostris darwini]|uniref:Uncharacterized protein n=1 Tax=Caerostris darwini TaxID=1538125 RepID=A0AAV4SB50_9ARAC|nr:hypothetical protein CDAR_465421 [Caerostris darwini]